MSSQTTTTIDPVPGVVMGGAPEVLREVSQQVSGLRDILWAARAGAELMDTAAWVESVKSQLDAVQLDVVRGLEARGDAKRMGRTTTRRHPPITPDG